MNVQQNEQNANGYSRTQTVNGRVITETVDNASRSASYGIVGRGVAVTAEGRGGVSIEHRTRGAMRVIARPLRGTVRLAAESVRRFDATCHDPGVVDSLDASDETESAVVNRTGVCGVEHVYMIGFGQRPRRRSREGARPRSRQRS